MWVMLLHKNDVMFNLLVHAFYVALVHYVFWVVMSSWSKGEVIMPE